MTIGIEAKGKERDRLSQPFLKFMQEFGISEERIKFEKIKSAEDEDWIAEKIWYQINVEQPVSKNRFIKPQKHQSLLQHRNWCFFVTTPSLSTKT
ncbi:MAG: hypothetical protein ACI9XO_003487 [Paraglaciecola sp.]|jgi:hypothetical protein